MSSLWKPNLKLQAEEIIEQTVNSQNLEKYLGKSEDFTLNDFYINGDKDLKISLAYIEGLADTKQINETILKPITKEIDLSEEKNEDKIIDLIIHGEVYFSSRKVEENLSNVISSVLEGFCVLIFDKAEKAIVFEVKGFEKRGIDEPADETVIKGPKDCFVETLRVNTSLIRRYIRSYNLIIEKFDIGKTSKKPVAIAYLNNVADENLVKKVKKRIENIKIENILSAGNFEEQIIDKKKSFFPQVRYTERPDALCANIMEGKIGIIIDGFPIAYIVPSTFNMLFQSPEDYAINYFMASITRFLRYICAGFTLILPAFYIAITTFHQEMIPSELTISIIKSKEGVPINTFIEVLLMLIAFEILMQAGARLPKSIGQTISIVGGLIVGDAAINAKFVSPGIVVVVAIAAVSGYVLPSRDLANAFRICRFLLAAAASIAGLFGLTIGIILLIYYLSTIETFGIPYLMPFSSNEGKRMLNDTIIRKPKKGDI